jgi:hypothetical protein
VEYLRQVIIVKNFIWKTETSQKRSSEDFCGVGGIPVTGQKGLSEYLYLITETGQVKHVRIFVVGH